ncbi:MAG: TonB-dependent receptor [Verrucomicrobia bacterium]|nr:TonB-dependent receptor [Verrucomicrobiota bacterium]
MNYPAPATAGWSFRSPVSVVSARVLRCLGAALLAAGLWAGGAATAAPATGTGAVQGRVYNPATQQYVRNAEVRLEGTAQQAVTEGDGSFQFLQVPAGRTTLSVSYTGYPTVRDTFEVPAGQTAVREINLTAAPASGDSVVQLSAFTVTSEREGNAKAIMEQRRSMDITTSVASDIFGDVTDGNVGEFLKFLPGVDVDYVESETRGPRLGGMDAQYVGVSFDGVRVASADANRTGDLGRATSFEAFSISSIESIEINRTTSPDTSADSPAGTINMKTRRAFDRKGRRISYNFSVNLNSEEFHLQRTFGPGGKAEYKARPNWSLEYSDVFLGQRLGVVASFSHVDSYTEQYRHNLTYNLSPTAADPRPMVTTALNFKDGPKNIAKDTYTLTADYKASSRLVLSGTLIYNYSLGQSFNREVTFNAATNNSNANTGRANVLGDGLTTVRTNGLATNTSRNSALGGGGQSKYTYTVTAAPKFEYRLGALTVDGQATYSRADNNYDGLERGHTRLTDVNSITSDFVATRSSPTSHEWTIQQLSGADWFNLSNRTNPRLGNEARYARTEEYTGTLNARWSARLGPLPVVLKVGGKWNEENRKNGNESSYYTYSYIGPGGNVLNPATGAIATVGSWGAYPNRNFWDTGTTNILTLKDLTGQVRPEFIPRPDDHALGALFKLHPEYFVNIASADNYYNAFIAPRRNLVQTISAAYGMADVRLAPHVTLRTGLRWEKTENVTRDFDPLTNREVAAAGFPVNTAARPTTIAGYQYQYFTRPLISRRKAYDNFFPMVSVKYNLRPSLQFHAGYNQAISRPPPDSLSGAWLINEDAQLITSPNPNLLPEYSKNYVARLAYYFEPAGQLSVTVTQNDIRNLRLTRRGTAEEFGLGDDPEYGSYEFQAPFNVQGSRRHRGLEIGYSQSLPFRQEWLRGLTLNSAYTRSYSNARRGNLLPHRVTSSVGYAYRRLRLRVGVVWRDDTPESTYGRFRRHDAKLDLGGEFKLGRNSALFFQGRNIFNGGQTWLETPAGAVEGQGAAVRLYENYGANWNFGVKGTF